MEKYATNLEELVEERTAQLQVEKKKTDDLLESMLPKYGRLNLLFIRVVAEDTLLNFGAVLNLRNFER